MHSPLFESLALVSHDNIFLWIHTNRVVPGLMLHLTPPGCDGNKYVHFEFYFLHVFFFIVELYIDKFCVSFSTLDESLGFGKWQTKGLSIYDGLLMMSRLHRFGCFFVPPIFESYKKEHQLQCSQFEKKTNQSQFLFKSMFNFL